MKLLLHLMRKDFRYIRFWMLATLAISAVALCYPLIPLEERASDIQWLVLPRYAGWAAFVLTIIRLFTPDAPLSGTSFLGAKPVQLSSLITAKGLLIFLLVLPMASLQCLVITLLGIQPGAGAHLLVLTEEILILSAIGVTSILIALQRNSSGRYPVSVFGYSFAAFVLAYGVNQYRQWLLQSGQMEWSRAMEYLELSRVLATQIALVVGGILTMAWFCCARKPGLLIWGLGIPIGCAIGSWFFWPVNFVSACVPEPRQAPRNEWPDPSRIQFSFLDTGVSVPSGLRFNKSERDEFTYVGISRYYEVAELPPGWVAGPQNTYTSTLKLSDGTLLSSGQTAWAPINPAWILPSLGIKNGLKPAGSFLNADLAQYNVEHAGSLRTGVTLKGKMQIPLKRPVLLARIPLEKGRSARVAGRLIEIAEVRVLADEIQFRVISQSAIENLKGGWQNIWTDRLAYIAINAARGESLQSNGYRQNTPQAAHYAIQDNECRGVLDPGSSKMIPADWIDHAELLIIGEENGGYFTQPFEFNDVTLGASQ